MEQNSTCFGLFLCPSSGFFFYFTQVNRHMSYSVRAGSGRIRPDPARKLSKILYDIYDCCVCSEKLLMMGQRDYPKHVVFCSKNQLEKLVHLVGFIIRIYYDTRSSECERKSILLCPLCQRESARFRRHESSRKMNTCFMWVSVE